MNANATRRSGGREGTQRLKLAVLLLGCVAAGCAFVAADKTSASVEHPLTLAAVQTPDPAQDFSKFSHNSAQHMRMPCLLCHKREDNSPALKLSGHLPCAGCHVQQFVDPNGQICTICHTTGSALKQFPALRSFNVTFDHGRHTAQTNCATCHKTSRRGVALSVPSGASAHQTCFQCHGPRTEVAGRNIGSCGICHQPGRPVRGSESAKAFTENFSHQEHLRKGNMNCATCHTVLAGAVKGRQVSAPLPAMHAAPAGTRSCATCHNNARAFGIGDFANCKRCHQGKGFKF